MSVRIVVKQGKIAEIVLLLGDSGQEKWITDEGRHLAKERIFQFV